MVNWELKEERSWKLFYLITHKGCSAMKEMPEEDNLYDSIRNLGSQAFQA